MRASRCALSRSGNSFRVLAAVGAWLALPGAVSGSQLVITVDGLRSTRGMLRACLTRDPAHFPDCEADPGALSASAPASTGEIRLPVVPRGAWAVSVLHDENGNAKVDKSLGIPREGVGFSRNPRLWFGPPKFSQVRVILGEGESRQVVRLRYFL